VIASLFGKASKSLLAVVKLSKAGFGQDALVIVRSMVNAAIVGAYIVSRDDPDAAARDFISSGVKAQREYLKQFRRPLPAWARGTQWTRLEEAAKRWDRTSIWKKATDGGSSNLYRFSYRFMGDYPALDT
jgi:hypothetical protein